MLCRPYDVCTFQTNALRLVSNIQWVKCNAVVFTANTVLPYIVFFGCNIAAATPIVSVSSKGHKIKLKSSYLTYRACPISRH